MSPRTILAAMTALLLAALPAHAQDGAGIGGKLLLTNGVSTIEGASGGGLTPWAVIAGNETRDGVGVQGAVTAAELKSYDFRAYTLAIGIRDRVEISIARQSFNTNEIGGALGLGNNYAFDQDVLGAKVKLFGDAVYGPELLPAVAVGVEYKHSRNGTIVKAIGARHEAGTDFYASATKLFLGRSVLLNVTGRLTRANQNGLLGFGGIDDHYRFNVEGSAAYQLSRRLVIGGEYRMKPDNMAIAREDDWFDFFAAYAIGRHLTVTAAYTDLGSIATVPGQRGGLLQLQAAF
jgi:hypothetical protein